MIFSLSEHSYFHFSIIFREKLPRKTKVKEHDVFLENNALTAFSLYIQCQPLSTQKNE